VPSRSRRGRRPSRIGIRRIFGLSTCPMSIPSPCASAIARLGHRCPTQRRQRLTSRGVPTSDTYRFPAAWHALQTGSVIARVASAAKRPGRLKRRDGRSRR
jgi:hypothetical protein